MLYEIKKKFGFYIMLTLVVMALFQKQLNINLFAYLQGLFFKTNFFSVATLVIIGIIMLCLFNKIKSVSRFYFVSSLVSYFGICFSILEKWFNIFSIDKNFLFTINIISVILSLFFLIKIGKTINKVRR